MPCSDARIHEIGMSLYSDDAMSSSGPDAAFDHTNHITSGEAARADLETGAPLAIKTLRSPILPISGSFHAITRLQASVRRAMASRKFSRVMVLSSIAQAKQRDKARKQRGAECSARTTMHVSRARSLVSCLIVATKGRFCLRPLLNLHR